jgi:hypothetical protein
MRKRSGLKVGMVCALVVSGVAAMPAPSWATTTLSTTVASTSSTGPNSANTEVTSVANCSSKLVSGGGARVVVTSGTMPNGLKLDGTVPSTNGTGQSANGDTSPTYWIGAGGAGGAAPSNAQTWGYGMCISSGPSATLVEAPSTSGPNTGDTIAVATATCPAGDRLLSGGARTSPGTAGSLKIIGSFPSNSSGTPVTSGTNPASWTAVGLNGGGVGTNTTYAFAVCSTDATNPTINVENHEVAGPTLASSGAAATVSCPANTVLVGGGAFISNSFGKPASQGDHLTGDFPSDSSGNPVTSGSAGSWTAESHTGGMSSSGTTTDVWALCGSQTY